MIKKITKEFKILWVRTKAINKNIEYFDDMTLFKYATNDGSLIKNSIKEFRLKLIKEN